MLEKEVVESKLRFLEEYLVDLNNWLKIDESYGAIKYFKGPVEEFKDQILKNCDRLTKRIARNAIAASQNCGLFKNGSDSVVYVSSSW